MRVPIVSNNRVSFVLAPFIVSTFLLITSVTASAALHNSYDLDGDFSDTLGNGDDLVGEAANLNPVPGRYEFTDTLTHQGLQLTSALPNTATYAIEIKLKKTSPQEDDYAKLIDFQQLVSDNGLYLYADKILFYPDDIPSGSVAVDTDFVVGISRSGGVIEIFLDGVSIFSTNDDLNGDGISITNVLNFFVDDEATDRLEGFGGSVDWIRIHDDTSTFSPAPLRLAPPPWRKALYLPPTDVLDAFQTTALNATNAVRSSATPAPSPALPPMVWDADVAKVAQKFADECVFGHNDNRMEGYKALTGDDLWIGENVAATAILSTPTEVAIDRIAAWAAEASNYDYDSNSCSDGACSHYTQLVWRNTTAVGCAIASCDAIVGSAAGTFMVCNYAPGGNLNGESPY